MRGGRGKGASPEADRFRVEDVDLIAHAEQLADGLAQRAQQLALLGVLVVAALQPVIPMKVVAWASGIVGIPIGPYLACMAVGRGKRLYLLAAAIRWGGERAESHLHSRGGRPGVLHGVLRAVCATEDRRPAVNDDKDW